VCLTLINRHTEGWLTLTEVCPTPTKVCPTLVCPTLGVSNTNPGGVQHSPRCVQHSLVEDFADRDDGLLVLVPALVVHVVERRRVLRRLVRGLRANQGFGFRVWGLGLRVEALPTHPDICRTQEMRVRDSRNARLLVYSMRSRRLPTHTDTYVAFGVHVVKRRRILRRLVRGLHRKVDVRLPGFEPVGGQYRTLSRRGLPTNPNSKHCFGLT